MAEFQEQAGRRGSEWLSAFGHAQATFTRELAEALPAAARDVGQRARSASTRTARRS
jgi:23S rRNA maturation mini-RNase III